MVLSRAKIPFATLSFAVLILFTACTPRQDTNEGTNSANNDAPPVQKISASIPPSAAKDMAAFEGEVFVATTEPIAELWLEAGWSIDDQPIDTDTQAVPLDCTLYPHDGVPNQWVGSCRGNTLVPRAGASHIAVVITNPDGSTTMIQVAPPSNLP